MPPPKLGLALEIPGDGGGAPATSRVVKDDAPATNLCDSWKVNANGALEMLSKSFNPYQFSSQGLIKANGNQHYRICEEDIVTVKTIGRGASSTVYKGFLHAEKRFVAVKKINIFDKEMRQQMMNDVKALCDTPNVPGLIAFYGAYHVPGSGQICIVLEYMDGGSLADLLRKVGRVPEPELAWITGAVLGGLARLHRRKMVHRDIKPANILLSCSGVAKISDFGISAFIDSTLAQCHTFTGTVTYMSPERINNLPYSFPADIWSLGMVLLECATGRYPFDASRGPVELMLQLMQDEAPLPPQGACSAELRDLLTQCLRKEPHQRPSAEQLLQHPFVVQHQATARGLRAFMQRVAFNPAEKLDEIALVFAWSYYQRLSQGRVGVAQLETLYTADSVMVHEGKRCVGGEAVVGALRAMAAMHDSWGGVVFRVRHVDCQPLGPTGSALLLVNGSVRMGGAAGGDAAFSETFVLSPSQAGEYCISSQAFRVPKGEVQEG